MLVDDFIEGRIGLFDWHLEYEYTESFENDLRSYRRRRRKLIEKDAEEQAAYQRAWKEHNKKKIKAINHRRAERLNALPKYFTEQHWRDCLDYFGHRCAVCGRCPDMFTRLAKAHWIPVSHRDCPGTVVTNILPLCDGLYGCNQSQGDKLPQMWLDNFFGKRKASDILKRVAIYFDKVGKIAA